jgi:hypothetical protein
MFTRVTPKHFFFGSRPTLAPVGEELEQFLEALGRLRMVVEGLMQARKRGVRQDVDRRNASASSSSERSPCARPTR